MIYCLSVHHTGTWTTLTWLNRHRDCKGFIQEAHAHESMDGGRVVHKLESGDYVEKFDPAMVYHEHVRRDPVNPPLRMAAAQMVMAAVHATVIPLRDPLATLVTYQKWAERDGRARWGISPMFSPRVHVDHWRALASAWPIFGQFAHVKPICWDLIDQGDPGALADVEDAVGFEDRVGWTIDNSAGRYPLKRAYEKRNVKALRNHIDDDGFDYLAAHEDELRPFLEGLGYRDLLWWS